MTIAIVTETFLPSVDGVDTVGLLLAEIGQGDGVAAPSVSHPPAGCCS